MTKGFRWLSDTVPIADIKKALCLMRYRDSRPTTASLAYASI